MMLILSSAFVFAIAKIRFISLIYNFLYAILLKKKHLDCLALVIHLLSLPNITSMSISSSLCLKFPLLVLRYSGTEDTNFLK